MVRLRETGAKPILIEATFQFQYGAIESRINEENAVTDEYFNSNMVRLRVDLGKDAVGLVLFQFQYGAIESYVLVKLIHLII